jgi:glycosyltransferase involved in cell wall biosynthesis
VRLLWVAPRFGAEMVGGAEILVRGLATHATPVGWTADVATTCAVDHETWANVLPPGETRENGMRILRFPVGPRNAGRYEELHPIVLTGESTYGEELEWLANSVWSPDLLHFLDQEGSSYDLVLFSPYLFGTTVWGAQVAPERSALMPCLHDEPYARLETVKRVVEAARGCVFNTDAEETLARKLYRVSEGQVVGMGFDAPVGRPAADFAASRGLGSYVLYAGRLEEGKRVHVAAEYAVRYAREREDAPKLVLIGRGNYLPPEEADEVVVRVGFVSEEEKRGAYAEALALVNPSHMESLSLVLMEAWLEGTPALLDEGSDVLREHAERSGGALTFSSYEGYRDALDSLREDAELRERLGTAGRDYVLGAYGWPAVQRRFRDAVETLVS